MRFAALILAIATIHIAISFVRWSESDGSLPIAVEKYIEPSSDDRRQIVITSKSLEQEPDNSVAPRFFADKKNRPKEETQSARKGRFLQDERFAGPNLPGFGESGAPLGPWGIPSQNPYDLPESIRKGANTVLSADPVLYASFLHRVADQLYDPWSNLVRNALREMGDRRITLSENTYETKLSIQMDRMGDLRSIQIVESSGYLSLDNAAKQAFWDNEPFTNPPSQLFREGEAIVKLEYSFNVYLKNSNFSIIPVPL